MRFVTNLIRSAKARKAYLAYVTLAIILTVSLAFMVTSKLSHHEENMIAAAESGQLKVFDLASGEEVEVDAILHKKPEHSTEVKHETAAATTPAMPIKQADVMFIIDNLGANRTDTEKAIELPAEFMLAFSPYAESSLELSQAAHAKNHVILVDLPLQSKDSTVTAGNLALIIENNDFKNSRNLEAALSKVYQPSGVLTPEDEIFSHSNNFNATLRQIAQQKLFLAYSGEGDDIDTKTKDNDVGLLKIDLILDDSDKPEDLNRQLAEVETLIKQSGLAVVMIENPSPATIDILAKWAEGLKAKNINLISAKR